MSESGSEKQEKLTPWVIGALAVIMLALGAFMSFGGTFHHKADIDVSASSRPNSQ